MNEVIHHEELNLYETLKKATTSSRTWVLKDDKSVEGSKRTSSIWFRNYCRIANVP